MQSKLPKLSCRVWNSFLVAALFALPRAEAALTYTSYGWSNPVISGNSFYYAAKKYDASDTVSDPTNKLGCGIVLPSGYPLIDLEATWSVSPSINNMVRVLIKSSSAITAPAGTTLAVMARLSGTLDTTTPIYLPLAATFDSICGAGGSCYSAGQTPTNLLTDTNTNFAVPFDPVNGAAVGFFPSEVCTRYYNKNGSVPLTSVCEVNSKPTQNAAVDPKSVPISKGVPLTITFDIVALPNGGASAPTGSALGSGTASFYFQFQPSALSCNIASNAGVYYPGDGQIFVDTGAMVLTAGSCAPDTTVLAPATSVTLVGNLNSSNPDVSANYATANSIVQTAGTSGFNAFGGFSNTTATSIPKYNVAFMVQDATGMLARGAALWAGYPDDSDCSIGDVQTTSINGFLNSSRCFIATAAYASADSIPVVMLRQFRDQILEESSFGRHFVRTYYRYSPRAADWLLEHPAFRIPILTVLTPVELLAFGTLHPFVAIFLLALGTSLILFSNRQRWL